jgi:hypothetical protein
VDTGLPCGPAQAQRSIDSAAAALFNGWMMAFMRRCKALIAWVWPKRLHMGGG